MRFSLKNTKSLVSIVLVTVAVMIALPAISAAMSAVPPSYVTYQNDEYGFNFTYPASWGEVRHPYGPHWVRSEVRMLLITRLVEGKAVQIVCPLPSYNCCGLNPIGMKFSVDVRPVPGRPLMEEVYYSPVKEAYYSLVEEAYHAYMQSEEVEAEKIILNGRVGYSKSGWTEDSDVRHGYWSYSRTAYFVEDGFFYKIRASIWSWKTNYLAAKHKEGFLASEADLDRIFNSFIIGPPPAGEESTYLCARPVDFRILGNFANHAYIDDKHRAKRYALFHEGGSYLNGYARKRDSSPDPKAYIPVCKLCLPKIGQTQADLSKCLEEKYNNYPDPSKYSAIDCWRLHFGPNSNTFAATLAKCCRDSSPSGLGWVPGWNHAQAEKWEGKKEE